jgi:transporter family-2 protein
LDRRTHDPVDGTGARVSNASLFYASIALIGGAAVPFLASINAAYGTAIGSVYWASITLCIVAMISILTVWALSGGTLPTRAAVGAVSWWHLTAGCFFMVYVVSITFVAPKIGVGNAIIFVVVAQMVTAVVIDHFGLFGTSVVELDWKRALGLGLLVAGVALAKSQPAGAG